MAPHITCGVFASLLSLLVNRRRAALPTHVRRLEIPGDRWSIELTLAASLRHGDSILCVAGDVVPCDGMVVDGSAIVETGGDASRLLVAGSSVSAGARVVTNFLVVRIAVLRSA